jgi:rsbT co-antagonist protein RsbR
MGDAAQREAHVTNWRKSFAELEQAITQYEGVALNQEDRQQVARWRKTSLLYRGMFLDVAQRISEGTIITSQAANNALGPTKDEIAELTESALVASRQQRQNVSATSAGLDELGIRLVLLLAATGLIALLVAAGVSLVLPRRFLRPIERLQAAAQSVAHGDLAARVDWELDDELGRLAGNFNAMTSALAQQREGLVQLEVVQAAHIEAEKARAELAEQLEMIEAQRAVIQQMSVPILPLNATTLVMPLVGALDTTRLQVMQEQALQAIERSTARYLILDITGVPILDTQVAHGLLNIVVAARLLGAKVVLVGIRPEVAQTVVGLGIRLEEVVTRASLQGGIAYALHGQ